MEKKNIFFIIFIIIVFIKVWKMDTDDRTHPYGLDKRKNDIVPHLVGEEYGVDVYKGRPDPSDSRRKTIRRIEWLASSHRDEVIWRRSFVFAVILTALVQFYLPKFEIKAFISMVLIGFVLFYFYQSYYSFHVLNKREKYIKENMRKIKNL
jgi:hypothetical protein